MNAAWLLWSSTAEAALGQACEVHIAGGRGTALEPKLVPRKPPRPFGSCSLQVLRARKVARTLARLCRHVGDASLDYSAHYGVALTAASRRWGKAFPDMPWCCVHGAPPSTVFHALAHARQQLAALLGADIEKAESLAAAAAEGETCTVANDNDPSQVVISGHKGAIDRAILLAKDHDIKRGILLPVSAPFHCPLMQPAADDMASALATTTIHAPLVPLFANVTAAPVSDPATISTQLVEQVTGRVRWRESAIAMAEAGVTHFAEFGGKVLSPMVKRSAGEDITTSIVISMDDIEALLKDI